MSRDVREDYSKIRNRQIKARHARLLTLAVTVEAVHAALAEAATLPADPVLAAMLAAEDLVEAREEADHKANIARLASEGFGPMDDATEAELDTRVASILAEADAADAAETWVQSTARVEIEEVIPEWEVLPQNWTNL